MEDLKKNVKEILEDMWFYNCQLCNNNLYNWNIEVHHIVYRSEEPKHPMMHSKANLLICCRACHSWLHEVKSRRNDLVKERWLSEIFWSNKER